MLMKGDKLVRVGLEAVGRHQMPPNWQSQAASETCPTLHWHMKYLEVVLHVH